MDEPKSFVTDEEYKKRGSILCTNTRLVIDYSEVAGVDRKTAIRELADWEHRANHNALSKALGTDTSAHALTH